MADKYTIQKYTTQQKIDLANSMIDEFCDGTSAVNEFMLKHLRKLEKKYNKSPDSYLQQYFTIPLSDVPEKHIKLMAALDFFEFETGMPLSHHEGFYKTISATKPGITEIKHFITVDAYVHLMLTEVAILNMYVDGKAS